MIYHPVQYFSLSHKLIYPIKNILIIILFKTFLVTKINLPDKNIGLSTCSILFFAKNQCTWSKTGQYSWGTFSIVFRLIVLSSAARLRNRGILFKKSKWQLFKVKTWCGKMMFSSFEKLEKYQARARSAQARKACALRALGLLLADGAPTVGGGKTFWQVN